MNIKPLDIIFTTSLSPISLLIKIKEVGLFKCFNSSVASHVGIVIPIDFNDIAIAEMLTTLKITPFIEYSNHGFWKNRIVAVRRFESFQDPVVSRNVINQILTWWKYGEEYDYEGVAKFIFPFLKDQKNKLYCSEMIAYLINNFGKVGLDDDNKTPYYLQKSKLLTDVTDWK